MVKRIIKIKSNKFEETVAEKKNTNFSVPFFFDKQFSFKKNQDHFYNTQHIIKIRNLYKHKSYSQILFHFLGGVIKWTVHTIKTLLITTCTTNNIC